MEVYLADGAVDCKGLSPRPRWLLHNSGSWGHLLEAGSGGRDGSTLGLGRRAGSPPFQTSVFIFKDVPRLFMQTPWKLDFYSPTFVLRTWGMITPGEMSTGGGQF